MSSILGVSPRTVSSTNLGLRQTMGYALPVPTLVSRVDAPSADTTFLSVQYITWINDNKTAWTMNAAGTAADTRVNIGPRPVPQEPMVRVIVYCVPSIPTDILPFSDF